MKLALNQLTKHLQDRLAAVYVVSGDEPLLCQEATDAICSRARAEGFTERQRWSSDSSDWSEFYALSTSLSLFAERRILDVRIPNGKPGDQGATALLEYVAQIPSDTLLLLSLPKLDSATQKTKWAMALNEHPDTVFINIWPISVQELPVWIAQRFVSKGIVAREEAISLLVERVEGNLLAAAQEIEKISLLAATPEIDADFVRTAVGHHARYDLFGLVDAALNAQAAHVVHMLSSVRAEGVEGLLVCTVLAREIRLLNGLARQLRQGVGLEQAFASARPPVWAKRKALLEKALRRHKVSDFNHMLSCLQQADAQLKGQAWGDPWQTLTAVCLALAGAPLSLEKIEYCAW